MIPSYVVLDKKLGQTPLQAIDAWRLEHPEHKDVPATYAGRLDPMATGKLLVLLGEECKRQEAYRGLDKEYEIEILLDFQTDTGDVLGIPTYVNAITHPSKSDVIRAVRAETGTKEVPYPAFSSKTVNGKPLFMYALEGTLDSISIPTHEEKIYAITHVGIRTIGIDGLQKKITAILSHAPRTNEPSKELGADFRQDEITSLWQSSLSSLENRTFMVLTLTVTCASGTYMRSIAQRIGEALNTQAAALSIHRTHVGKYLNLLPGLGVWTKTYH
jgi:tRNA pseudouridine(55) synthase